MTDNHMPPDWLKEEELDPVLVPFIKEGPFGQMIHHPLVVDMCPMIEQRRCNRTNTAYRAKLAEIRRLRAAEEWEKMLWFFERPYRLTFLVRYKQKILDSGTGKDYWRALRSAWSDAEWPSRLGEESIRYLFHHKGPHRPHGLMLKSEIGVLSSLPEKGVQIYRGVRRDAFEESPDKGMGWSWSTSPETARWFGDRFPSEGKWKKDHGVVLHGTCSRDDIIYYADTRGESEVVVPPERVHYVGFFLC